MAAIASFRAGGWSDTNTATNAWNATPPTDVDTVTITHAVTLDTTACVCDTLTINAGGTLQASQTANSKLVIDKGITQAASATASVNLDTSAVPQYTCTLQINKDASQAADNTTNAWAIGGPMTLKGASKKRATFTGSALTGNTTLQCDVDDATGWRVGDILIFAMTQPAPANLTVSNVTNPGTGYIEVTTSTAHGMVVGDDVMMTQLQTALNGLNFKINAVPTTTTFRIPYGALTITDTSGACSMQARTDTVTIATLTAVGGGAYSGTGPATVTWTDGTGTGGAVCHDHANDCLVANMTRNMVVTAGSDLAKLLLFWNNATYVRPIDNVMFRDFYGISGFPSGALSQTSGRIGNITNCVFYEFYGCVQTSSNAGGGPDPRQYNTYYSTKNGASLWNNGNQSALIGPDEYPIILRMTNTSAYSANMNWSNGYLLEPWISGVCGTSSSGFTNSSVLRLIPSGEKTVVGGAVWSCTGVMTTEQGGSGISAPVVFDGTRIGIGPPGVAADYSANNRHLLSSSGPQTIVFDSCPLASGHILHQAIGAGQSVIYKNKNNDAAVQEIYKNSSLTVPVMSRVVAAGDISNAPSALMMEWTGTGAYEHTRSIYVIVAAGATKTMLVRVKKNASYGASTRPTVSAYDGTTVASTATMADTTDTFETLTLSVTNSSAADKEYRVEFYGKSAVNGAKCWFSGIPLAPFITRCRHYGYVFDEASPTRTIDVLASANFATADAYTGMAITWGTSSSTAITTSNTFQKLFDYHQAKATQNVSSALALTGAGVAGSPTLFAAGNVTISDGAVLNGAGSISMGAYDLATEFASGVNYTYTGGTWSQIEAVPSFSGGTLTLGTKITTGGDFTMSSATIEFGAVGADWNLSDAAYAGTITLATTAGQSVTVAMPTGVTINNTEPGNITVTTPILSADIVWAGALDGTTVLLYNDSNAGAIIDTQTIVGAGGYAWNISLPHVDVAAGDSLRLRYGNKAYYADELQGTMTAAGITFVGSMVAHPVYAGWALNGATYDQANGGPFTMDGANLQVDIAAGATTGLKTQLGAWTQYLMTLPAGLDAFYGAWDLLAVNQIRQNVAVVDVKIDVPTAGALYTFTDNNVNYYRSDFTFPGNVQSGHGLIAMTYNAEPFVATVTGGNVITGDPSTVAAAVRSNLTAELTRVNKLAALSAIDAILVVTPTTRTAGTVSQTISTVGETTTVE